MYSGDLCNNEREDQASHVGGFPKPEDAIRGAPEALREVRGCADARLFGRVQLYYGELIVMQHIYAGINTASQEVFSTCNNCLVCCMVMYICIAGINAASQEVFSRTRGVIIHPAIKCYCVLLL